ncbi:MAG: glycosyl hydrolase family 65 protein, partial [Spirochaetaceae bacterium]|nr:glycosyl hydrolase family 65 protein [Spirochaetaceae bacterium]
MSDPAPAPALAPDKVIYDPWSVSERDLCPANASKLETVFAQANGYRCLRGASPFLRAMTPGNFIAGIFDKSEAEVTELVNAPDPLPIAFYLDYEAVEAGRPGFSGYSRTFDLKRGVVRSAAVYRAGTGAELELAMERFVSHGERGRWAERWTIKARNFSRRILIRTRIDGSIVSGASHPLEATKHFTVQTARALSDDQARPDGIILLSRTRDQGIEMAEAQALEGPDRLRLIKLRESSESIEGVWALALEAGETVTIERLGATCSSRDRDGDYASAESALAAFRREGYDAELSRHEAAIARLWENIDIVIDGDDRAQSGLRFNLFQLASCATPDDERVSIGAKGLHGEGYKGHVFWDTETFMLPFFIFTQPEIARDLLRYRCRTLEGARANARAGGFQGARFPWESADDGRETTPQWGIDYAGNPVRIWTGDIEVHINADITYAILKYYQVSGDEDFMRGGGLRVLFEIAVFWTSFAHYNPEKRRYEILDVIGPDEYHEHVDNNTYTNYLAKWALLRTVEIAGRWRLMEPEILDAIMSQAGVRADDFAAWQSVAEKMYIPIDVTADTIEQFEGYFGLEEHPIVAWDAKGMPLWPKGVDVARLTETTLIKQPDVVMLFALLGEEFSRETKIRNYEFYEKRTMHKSSLSPSMYAMVGMSIGKTEHAYDYFIKAVETDLADNQGNSAQGIHAANMGGVWQTAVFGFGGLSIDAAGLPSLEPWLPPRWSGLRYRFAWRGAGVLVSVTKDEISILSESEIEIVVEG